MKRSHLLALLGASLVMAAPMARADAQGLTAAMISGLPVIDKAVLEGGADRVVTETRSRDKVKGAKKREISGTLFLAPIVYDWAFSEGTDHFPPLWKRGETSPNFQAFVNSVAKQVTDGLTERGFTIATAQSLEALDVGDRPHAMRGRNRIGQMVDSYSYVQDKGKEWSPRDFSKLDPAAKGLGGAVFFHLHSVWDYDGHGRMDDEAIIIYDVGEWFDFTICDAAQHCESTQMAINLPIPTKRAMASEKAVNDSTRDALNRWAIRADSRVTAQTVLTILEAFIAPKH